MAFQAMVIGSALGDLGDLGDDALMVFLDFLVGDVGGDGVFGDEGGRQVK